MTHDPKVAVFLEKHRPMLAERIRVYLEGGIPHLAMQAHLDAVMGEWQGLRIDPSHDYWPGEDSFWAAVWATRQLADDTHWREGVTGRELGRILRLLGRGGRAPGKDDTGSP